MVFDPIISDHSMEEFAREFCSMMRASHRLRSRPVDALMSLAKIGFRFRH